VWLPKSQIVSAFLVALGTTSVVWAGSAAATTRSVPATNTVNESQYGFSFSMPPNWTAVPLSSTDTGALLNVAKSIDPSLSNVLDSQLTQAAKQGIKVYAVGPVSGAFFPSLNIGIESSSGSPTGQAFLSAVDAEVKIELTAAGMQDLKTSDVQLPMGNALQVMYKLPLKTTHIVTDVGVQLYLEHGSHIYVVTVSSLSSSLDQSVAHVVENSWHWK
jgi:hypothetical protein